MPKQTPIFLMVLLLCGGCTMVPDLPSDADMPLAEILNHSVCKLRATFMELDKIKSKSFDAKKWLIGISVTPKVNAEIIASVGLTGKSTSIASPKHLSTFSIGTAPGAQADVRGHSDGSLTFNVHSKDLINQSKYPVDCSHSTAAGVELDSNLGIREWLIRAVEAADSSANNLTQIYKPAYSSEIYIKFNGAGGYSYMFPLGTDFAGLSGSFDRDEILSIALAADDQTAVIIKVRTLPSGGTFGPVTRSTVVTSSESAARSQLDTVQIEQILRNLRLQPN